MPQKSLRRRVKRAKRSGVAPTWKESDLAREPHAVSAHGAKKSRHVVAQVQSTERTVGRKPRPGYGRAQPRPPKGPSPGAFVVQPTRHPAKVRGRKKPPSEMDVKHRGG